MLVLKLNVVEKLDGHISFYLCLFTWVFIEIHPSLGSLWFSVILKCLSVLGGGGKLLLFYLTLIYCLVSWYSNIWTCASTLSFPYYLSQRGLLCVPDTPCSLHLHKILSPEICCVSVFCAERVNQFCTSFPKRIYFSPLEVWWLVLRNVHFVAVNSHCWFQNLMLSKINEYHEKLFSWILYFVLLTYDK